MTGGMKEGMIERIIERTTEGMAKSIILIRIWWVEYYSTKIY